ncbi:MAG TPA: hypothetical protein VGT03_03740 [Candidatus Acidoferrales bacterium]|nr:hypothetical protein [Candidatus Acidoferrales bacterium]
MPKIPGEAGRAAQEEVILTIAPDLYRCREERWRAIESDRQARAANAATGSRSGGFTPPASPPPVGALLAAPAPAQQASRQTSALTAPPSATGNGTLENDSLVGRGFNRDINASSSPSSSLPQAAVPNSAPPALTSSASRDALAARAGDLVASPSSTLPEAAPDKPATACPEQGRGAKQSPRAAGPQPGSSGSADPPFPFTPEPLRRRKPRRRF